MSTSEYFNRPDAVGFLKVRELLREWDPIGVYRLKGREWPPDEYDQYIPAIIRLLDAGGTVRQVTAELRDFAHKRMAISTPRSYDRTIAKKLVAFWKEWKR